MLIFRRPFLLGPSPPLFDLLLRAPTSVVVATKHNSAAFFGIRCLSSDSTTVADPVVAPARQPHPWSEWVGFVDHLRAKGYFSDSGLSKWDTNIYMEMSQLKEPCLSFGRDRYDVFKFLSAQDIRKVVDSGCPNLFRKVVNSAKRLRVFLHLDEAGVCGACNLRGSCDRAYVVPKDSEGGARTVDVVRMLLFCALDPLVTSYETQPSGRADMETAARRLLSELIELSKKPPDPSLPKPVTKGVGGKEVNFNSLNEKVSVEKKMRQGDWMCPKCEFMNFSRNLRCWKCDGEGPKQAGHYNSELKKGDWICPKCSVLNFSRNRDCFKCRAEGPKRVDMNAVPMKKGDWSCPQCDFLNFASNKACLRCQEKRPDRTLRPGDWECPSCDFLNFKGNSVCLKCMVKRPAEESEDGDDHVWRSLF